MANGDNQWPWLLIPTKGHGQRPWQQDMGNGTWPQWPLPWSMARAIGHGHARNHRPCGILAVNSFPTPSFRLLSVQYLAQVGPYVWSRISNEQLSETLTTIGRKEQLQAMVMQTLWNKNSMNDFEYEYNDCRSHHPLDWGPYLGHSS